MRAPVDAFVNLAHLLGDEHLTRFSEAARAVFSKIAPPPDPNEPFRLTSPKNEMHSNWLREGMMTTLLLMAALHEESDFLISGSSPQNFVNEIIRSLPGLSSDYRLLASLQDNLPLLAEAAPDPFLDALDQLLEGDGSAIRPIFDEHKGFIDVQTYHTGLLWALETLAWDPQYLFRASLCLARLAAIDPGGKLSNRPINSLREIFLTWHPHTRANVYQRLGVLNSIIKSVPKIAWPLLAKLLPNFHSTSTSTAKPKFRESVGATSEVLTYNIVWNSQTQIVILALSVIGEDVDKWAILIRQISQFREEALIKTIETLDVVLKSVPVDAQQALWDLLRKEVNRNKAYATSDWTLKKDSLERVEHLVIKYKSDDPLLNEKWLFDDWSPDVSTPSDSPSKQIENIKEQRDQAVLNILSIEGITGILNLAKKVKQPHILIDSIASLSISKHQLIELLELSIETDSKLDFFTRFSVANGYVRFGNSWTNDLKKIFDKFALTPENIGKSMTALPENRGSWNIVEQFGDEVNDAYWGSKNARYVSGPKDDLIYAVESYLSRGRALDAIQTSVRQLSELPSQLIIQLLDVAVPQINANGINTMTAYYIEKVFEELERRTDIDLTVVAAKEFAYLPFFSDSKKDLTLHRLMVKNPETYMSVICAVFFPNNTQDTKEISPQEKQLAHASYELLQGLKILPGQDGDHIDVDTLQTWCIEVRELAKIKDREKITDTYIGYMFSHAPSSTSDGIWPHEVVRHLIEEIASNEVEEGIETERFNMRGVVSRAHGEGGRQERELALQAQNASEALSAWPRTASMLTRISQMWLNQAKEVDIRAEKNSLRR